MGKNIKLEKVFFIVMLFLASIILIYAVSRKRNYHVDELLSYTLANNWTGWMFYEEGVKYESPDDYFDKQFGAQYGRRLKYDTVWENQSNDSHPPFFYALLHTICSFSPEKVSIWQAGAINILFGIFNMIIISRLLLLLMDKCNKYCIYIISFMYTILPGTIDNISFFRMYAVAMFWVTLVTYASLLIKKRSEEVQRVEYKYWALFVLSSFMGVLTHYYCAIYIVLLNVVLLVFFLAKKKYRLLITQCLSSLIAAGIAIVIFPAMLRQLFVGRGEEVQDNLVGSSFGDFLYHARLFLQRLDNGLFGGLLIYILILLVVGVVCKTIYSKCTKKESITLFHDMDLWSYGIILFPVIAYFLLICKVTVFMETRYMFPIYSVAYVVFVAILYNCIYDILNRKTTLVVMLILVVFSIFSYSKAKWEYLYLNDSLQDTMVEYSDLDGIVLDDGYTWKCVTAYREVRQCRSVTFYTVDKFSKEADAILSLDECVLFSENEDILLEQVKSLGKNCLYLGHFGYYNAYHIY